MWNLKKCPRCRGDIFIDEDVEGIYEKCLQCGYEREVGKTAALRENHRTEKDKTRIN